MLGVEGSALDLEEEALLDLPSRVRCVRRATRQTLSIRVRNRNQHAIGRVVDCIRAQATERGTVIRRELRVATASRAASSFVGKYATPDALRQALDTQLGTLRTRLASVESAKGTLEP